MTEYVILKATNEPGTIFAIVGQARGHSPEHALRLWAATDGDAAIFAAVPKRSWVIAKVEGAIPKYAWTVTRL